MPRTGSRSRRSSANRLRTASSSRCSATREHCVSIWCAADFDAYVESLLEGMHPLSEDYGKIERFFNAYSSELDLDAAGRVMVPAKLLEAAGLGKDVAVIGAGKRLEVWDREAWLGASQELLSTVKEIGPGCSEWPHCLR